MHGNAKDYLDEAVSDLHEFTGWTGYVYTQSKLGETDGGRTQWEDLANITPTETTIRIRWPTMPSTVSDGSGLDTLADAEIAVDPDTVTVSTGDETTRASVIEDGRDGARYRVLRRKDAETGVQWYSCETMTD